MQNGQSYQRIFVVIIDSLGIGATADANQFESLGADTLGHLGEHFRVRLQLPTFQKMGVLATCTRLWGCLRLKIFTLLMVK